MKPATYQELKMSAYTNIIITITMINKCFGAVTHHRARETHVYNAYVHEDKRIIESIRNVKVVNKILLFVSWKYYVCLSDLFELSSDVAVIFLFVIWLLLCVARLAQRKVCSIAGLLLHIFRIKTNATSVHLYVGLWIVHGYNLTRKSTHIRI